MEQKKIDRINELARKSKTEKGLTEEEKAAKKQHIKEEIQAYLCMFLFLALFAVMFAMFGSQSSLFGR